MHHQLCDQEIESKEHYDCHSAVYNGTRGRYHCPVEKYFNVSVYLKMLSTLPWTDTVKLETTNLDQPGNATKHKDSRMVIHMSKDLHRIMDAISLTEARDWPIYTYGLENPKCQLCNQVGSLEHYVCQCPVYYEIRRKDHCLFWEEFEPPHKVMEYNNQRYHVLFQRSSSKLILQTLLNVCKQTSYSQLKQITTTRTIFFDVYYIVAPDQKHAT